MMIILKMIIDDDGNGDITLKLRTRMIMIYTMVLVVCSTTFLGRATENFQF